MNQVFEVWDYKIFDKGDDETDVYLDGDIVDASTEALYKEWFGDDSSMSYRTFRNKILEKSPKILNVYINSYGGMIYDAFAMHDFLIEQRNKGVKVNTKVRGIAASAATFVTLAGDEAEMSENSIFMIHNASGAIWGNVDDIERYAATMRKLNNQIVDLYAKRTGMSKEEIGNMMDEETHLTAEEAKEKGFIDKVTKSVSFKNIIKPENFQFKDKSILNFFNKQVKNSDMTVEDIKKTVTNTVTEVLKGLGILKPENKSELDQDAIIGQVVDKLTPVFENRVTELENQVQKEKDEKETAEQKVKDLGAKITDLETKVTNLQAQEGNPAPAGDPAPGNSGTLSDEQKEELAFENMCRGNMDLDPLSETDYLNLITPKKQK